MKQSDVINPTLQLTANKICIKTLSFWTPESLDNMLVQLCQIGLGSQKGIAQFCLFATLLSIITFLFWIQQQYFFLLFFFC